MHIKGRQVQTFELRCFQSLKIVFILTNSTDPDEMPHYAAFHLGLHCLQSTHLGEFSVYKGLRIKEFMIRPPDNGA